MRGDMVVADSAEAAESMLASRESPTPVKAWTLEDFKELEIPSDEESVVRGMHSFAKARCDQCHRINGHGINLGPELTKVRERFRGSKLLTQILDPSVEQSQAFRTYHFTMDDGRTVSGIVQAENDTNVYVVPNLLQPDRIVTIPKKEVESRDASNVSSMPAGLLDVLSRQEILDLLGFLEAGGIEHDH